MDNIKLCDIADYITSTPSSGVSSSFYIHGGEIFYKKITIIANGSTIKLYYNNILKRITVNGESFYNENATIASVVLSQRVDFAKSAQRSIN